VTEVPVSQVAAINAHIGRGGIDVRFIQEFGYVG
jgi:hypothetical protein